MHSTPQTIEIDRRDEDRIKPYRAECNCCPWKSLWRFTLGQSQKDAKRHRFQSPQCRTMKKGKKK